MLILTGIPRASGLTGTLKGSAASIFITFLTICTKKHKKTAKRKLLITESIIMLGQKKTKGNQYESSNTPLRRYPIRAYYIWD